jgi:hypothetical protein
VQNEPDWDTKGAYDMCLYTPAQMTAFVRQPGAAVAALNLPAPPKLIAPSAPPSAEAGGHRQCKSNEPRAVMPKSALAEVASLC